MSSLRKKVYKLVGGVPTLTELQRGDQTASLTTGPDNSELLNIVQFGADVTSQGLLNLAADLLANDKVIEQERNAINMLINEGVLDLQDWKFEITFNDSPVQATVDKGKAKLHQTSELYNVYTINSSNTFNVPVIQNITWYRRDLIQIVYIDTESGLETPYLEYIPGQEMSFIAPRQTILDRQITSTKCTYPLYSILYRNVTGVTTYIEHDTIFRWAGFKSTVRLFETGTFKRSNGGYYAELNQLKDHRTFTYENGEQLPINAGTTGESYASQASIYNIESICLNDPTGKLTLQEPDIQNVATDIANGGLLTIPFNVEEVFNQYSTSQDVELRQIQIAVDKDTVPEEGLQINIYTGKYFVDSNNYGIVGVTAVSVGGIRTTIDLDKSISSFSKLTANGITFEIPSGSVTVGDFILVINGNGLYQIAKIQQIFSSTQIAFDNLPITMNTTTKLLFFKNSTIFQIGETIDSAFLASKTEEERMWYERQYPITTNTGKGGVQYSNTTPLRAFTHGYKDISGGLNWSYIDGTFKVIMTIGGVVQPIETITLNAACADLDEIVTHVTARLAAEGVTGLEVYNGGNGHIGFRTTASGETEGFQLIAGDSNNALALLGVTAGTFMGITKPDIAKRFALPINSTNRLFHAMPNPPGSFEGHVKVIIPFKVRISYNQWYFARTSVLDRAVPYGSYGVRARVVTLNPTWAASNSSSICEYYEAQINTNPGLYPLQDSEGNYIFRLYDQYGDIADYSLAREVSGFPAYYRLIAKNLNGSAFVKPTTDGDAFVDVLNGIVSFKADPFQEPLSLKATYYYNNIITGDLDTSKIYHDSSDGEKWNLHVLIDQLLNPSQILKDGSTIFLVNIAPFIMDPTGSGLPYDFGPGDVLRYDERINTDFGWIKAQANGYSTLGEVMVIEKIDDAKFKCIQIGLVDNVGELITGYTPIILDQNGDQLDPNTMYYLSATHAGKLTKLRPQIPQPVLHTLQDAGGGVVNAMCIISDAAHVQYLYETKLSLEESVDGLQNHLNIANKKVNEIELELAYITQRESQNSDLFIDAFQNEHKTNLIFENGINATAEAMVHHDWQDNWVKTVNNPSFETKQGFMKPSKIKYKGDASDFYNIEGVGQSYKCSIKYDPFNRCYWMMTNHGGVSGFGEIIRFAETMKEGVLDMIRRWPLQAGDAGFTNPVWSGIDSDGEYLYFSLAASGGSIIIKSQINSDGTLGPGHTPSGTQLFFIDSTVDYPVLDSYVDCDSTAQYRVGAMIIDKGGSTYLNPAIRYFITEITSSTRMNLSSSTVSGTAGTNIRTFIIDANDIYTNSTASAYITDVVNYDDTNIGFLLQNGTTVTLYFLLKSGLNPTGALTAIQDFGPYVGGTINGGRTISRNGSDLYIRMNDNTDDKRFIYKFNTLYDIEYSTINRVIKSSARFNTYFSVDQLGWEGVCVGHHGDMMEVVNPSGGTSSIVRRSLKNTDWAENQIVIEMKTVVAPATPFALEVEDNRYFWTGDIAATANQVDIYRFDTISKNYKAARLSGSAISFNITHVLDLCINPNTGKLYLLTFDGTNYRIYCGDLSTFISSMSDNTDPGATIAIGTWADGGTHIITTTKVIQGIAYDYDADVLLLVNDSDDKIATSSLDGTTVVYDAYDLPAPIVGDRWYGIAYKNGNIYINDVHYASATMAKIYVLNKDKSTSSLWYRSHIHQDPSPAASSACIRGLAFYNNDLVTIRDYSGIIYAIKTLEDPNALQLQAFIDNNNVLPAVTVKDSTNGIMQRYFDPSDFDDERSVPGNYYIGLALGTAGAIILHLDEFFAYSSTGRIRYDVPKIRQWKYVPGTNNIIPASYSCDVIMAERDMLYLGCSYASGRPLMLLVNLKEDMIYAIGDSSSGYAGKRYNGVNSERNAGKGYVGIANPMFYITTTANADYFTNGCDVLTFEKEDVSDFTNELAKTFVALAHNKGTDLLVIDWTATNTRIIQNVWQNIWNNVNYIRNKIFPSGYIFGLENSANGNIAYIKEIWTILNHNKGYDALVGSNIIGNYPRDIAPGSVCARSPIGTWIHIPLIGVYDQSSGAPNWGICKIFGIGMSPYKESIRDVDNNGYMTYVDMFEDLVFEVTSAAGGADSGYIRVHKKYKYLVYGALDSSEKNFWMANYAQPAHTSSPRMSIIPGRTSGTCITYVCRFAKTKGVLLLGNYASGLEIHNFMNSQISEFESVEFNINNPEKCNFIQHFGIGE